MYLHQSKPLHYEDLPPTLWGGWMTELAMDIAAVNVLEHLEEAQRIPASAHGWQCYMLAGGGVVAWWSFRP